uniref:Yolk protein 1 n=1 Tax=Hyphantria cunea TaxID=39466 RepID=Q8T5R2_HYPCU|nr:yolk protein 1 [Hyphantria cunea]
MLEKYLILILLPSFAYSAIKISIEPIKNGTDASVKMIGSETIVVSDNDRKVFKLDDGTLKRPSEIYMGKRSGDVYLKPPTPWGDVYQQFNWEPVKKTVRPIEAKVVGINSKPVPFGNAEYVNKHETLTVTYSTSLTHQVEETVGNTWKQGGEVGVGMSIEYEINFGVGSAGGSTSMSYTASWGEETSKSRAVTLGSTSTILIEVPPKTMVVASLQATQGTMDIDVKYRSTLDGRVFCNYPDKFNGHYFYGMPARGLLSTIGQSVEVESVERISIGFYTTARLVVTNGTIV